MAEVYTAEARPNDSLPLIVVLHGYGGSPQDVLHLFDGFGMHARVIAPHGGFAVGEGWGWFALRWTRSPDELAPGISAAADRVLRILLDKTEGHPTCGKPIVVGFSQGAFISYALAARSPAVVGAALPLSGFLPASLRPRGARRGPLPRVDAYHGDLDEIVDPALDRETHASFVAAGFSGALHTYPGVAHAVPPQIATAVREQIARAIREAGCAR